MPKRASLTVRISQDLQHRLKVTCATLRMTQSDAFLAGLRMWAAKAGMPVLDLPDFRRVKDPPARAKAVESEATPEPEAPAPDPPRYERWWDGQMTEED